METKNILEEVSELLKSTCENLDYFISTTSPRSAELLKDIQITLCNLEKILKRESDRVKLEQSRKYQAYFFISENGYLSKFKEYCEENPLENF